MSEARRGHNQSSSGVTRVVRVIRRERPGRRWLPTALLALLIVAIAAVAAQRLVAGARDLSTTRHELDASRARLAHLGADIRAAGAARRDAQRRAAAAVAVLDSERDRHDAASRNLRVAKEQLAVVSHDLAASLRGEQQQGDQVAALQLCLDGVSQALNRIGVGDVHGWQAAIAAVDPQCHMAAGGA